MSAVQPSGADGNHPVLPQVTVSHTQYEQEKIWEPSPLSATEIMEEYINEPEVPESILFTAGMMKKVKAADPADKITLISPPRVNHLGSAEASYQLELPPARNNFKPQLHIVYNSDCKDGWLGKGWDLPVSTIKLDTTVSIYDPVNTSFYKLDNVEMTFSPLNTNTADPAQFYVERGKIFNRILRHGDTPDTYWWKITDEKGIIYTYGHPKEETPNGVQQGYIEGSWKMTSEWKLTQVENLNGDYTRYIYGNYGSVPYLDTIKIGNKGRDPHTLVVFRNRIRVEPHAGMHTGYGYTVDPGFLLEKIEIFLEDPAKDPQDKDRYTLLRSYTFNYDTEKDLLEEITHNYTRQYSGIPVVRPFSSTQMEYYDDREEKIKFEEYLSRHQEDTDTVFTDRTGKLRNVHTPLGGCFTLDYTTSDSIHLLNENFLPTGEKTGGRLVLKSVRINKGIEDAGPHMKNTFSYTHGQALPHRNQFLGFGNILESHWDTEADTIIRHRVSSYINTDPYQSGNLLSHAITGKDTAEKYMEEIYNYKNFQIQASGDSYSFVPVNNHTGQRSIYYAPLASRKTFMYQSPEEAFLIREEQFKYDYPSGKYGKPEAYLFYDRRNGGKQYEIQFSYISKTDLHIWSLLGGIVLRSSGEIVSEATLSYDDAGKLTRVTRPNPGTDPSVTDYEYDKESGNLVKKILPANANAQRMSYRYRYDRTYDMYIERIDDSYGYHSEMEEYDYRYGVPRTIRDINGYILEQKLDALGRRDTILAPDEQDAGKKYTVTFAYYPPQITRRDSCPNQEETDTVFVDVPERVLNNIFDENITRNIALSIRQSGKFTYCYVPWENGDRFIVSIDTLEPSGCFCADSVEPAYAITSAYDILHPQEDLKTWVYADGYGKPLQVKQTASITRFLSGPGSDVRTTSDSLVVSGRQVFDALGRIKEEYFPATQHISERNLFHRTKSQISPKSISYDVLDRVISLSQEDIHNETFTYGIDPQLHCQSIIIEGIREHNQIKYLMDACGQLVRKELTTPSSSLRIDYDYDAAGRLVKIISQEDDSRSVSYEYDRMGQIVQMKHPAAGTVIYAYDPAGNKISMQTARLKETGKSVLYQYDYNRLTRILYPENPANNVRYYYGDPNASHNRTGRLALQEDGTGAQEFYYGRTGELNKVRRTLVIPNQAIATYVTQCKYDSWDRLLEIIYPDGEKAVYAYDRGGLVESLSGGKTYTYQYIKKIGYNSYGERNYMHYANDAETYNTYGIVPFAYLLTHTQVWSREGTTRKILRHDEYLHDAGGTYGIYREFPNPEDAGKYYSMQQISDPLGRLSSDSTYYNEGRSVFSAWQKSLYNESGQLIKNSSEFGEESSQGEDFYISRIVNSHFDETSPYQVDSAILYERFSSSLPYDTLPYNYQYDADGNLLSIRTLYNGSQDYVPSRQFLWDEENRLQSVNNQGYVSHFWYDAQGNRTVKTSGETKNLFVNSLYSGGYSGTARFTAYINPYLEVSPQGEYTKHFFAGKERVASKTGDLESFGSDPRRIEYAGHGMEAIHIDYEAKYQASRQTIHDAFEKYDMRYEGTDNDDYVSGEGFCCKPAPTLRSGNVDKKDEEGRSQEDPECHQYYYHYDFLGNTGFMTDLSGKVAQETEYTSWGIIYFERKNDNWNTPYLFRGMEWDPETGLYHMQDGYYDPQRKYRLNVNPAWDLFPQTEPYLFHIRAPHLKNEQWTIPDK
jgi:YD repeat-containing protein